MLIEERVWAQPKPAMKIIRTAGPYDVLVKEDPPARVSPGGVYYPDEWIEDHPPCVGEALACGESVTFCKPNDRVAFSKLGPSLVPGTDFVVMEQDALFVRLRAPDAPGAPYADSISPWVRRNVDAIAPLHALIRPYKPVGFTPGQLFVERNDKHPAIWAWVLAISVADSVSFGVWAGDFVMFARHSDEEIASDTVRVQASEVGKDLRRPPKHEYRQLPVCIVKLRNLEAVAENSTILPDAA